MVNFNGNLVSDESLFLDHKNRGLRYGDALSESLRVLGGKLIFWEDHYLKLMASMRILRMEIPMNFTMEFLENQILRTIRGNHLEGSAALINLIIFRDAQGTLLPEKNDVAFCIESKKLSFSEYRIVNRSYEIELFKDFYTGSDLLTTLNTSNKMVNVVGSIFAKENGYDDCLLLNHDKMVVGSLMGNLFLVSGNNLKTPPLDDGCMNSVIREKIVKATEKVIDFEISETSISPFELQKADELFIADIESGVIPVTKYRKKNYTTLTSRRILEKLNEMVRAEKAS